jgi:hypothetical protein
MSRFIFLGEGTITVNVPTILSTMQTTIYHTGDNGDSQYGSSPAYSVLTADQYSGTTPVDTPHYAGNTISFDTATNKILDSANGMATFIAGDTIRVRGSASNDSVYTVATGATAGFLITTEALVLNEAAGAYITICKRTTPSNNCVQDLGINKMWRRYTTKAGKVGVASDGKLCWYDATKCFTIHAAAADLAMNAANKTLTIVGGAAEVTKFWAGQLIELAGFAVGGAGKCNNRAGGFRVISATANGADLDIVLWTGFVTTPVVLTGTTTNGNKVISGLSSTAGLRVGMAIAGTGVGAASIIATIDSATQVTGTVNSTASASVSVTFTTLATEAAGGSRSIKVVCQSIFAYVAACNAASLAGYTDWRIPYDLELANIRDMEAPTAAPNAAAFPSWPTDDYVWSATTYPTFTSNALVVSFGSGGISSNIKSTTYYVALLRGS